MDAIATKTKAPELNEAFAKVIESFGVLVSAQVSSIFQYRRGTITAAAIMAICFFLGLFLVASGIRDALITAIPNHAVLAVAGTGFVCIFAALGLLLMFLRSERN